MRSMRKHLLRVVRASGFLVAVLLLGCSRQEEGSTSDQAVEPVSAAAPAAAQTPTPRYTAAQFYETTSVRGGSFSHDESKLLISTNETGVFNVYAQPTSGGPRTPLTKSTTDAMYAVSYFPNDDRFLYLSDQGGNELDHLFVVEADGTAKDLTPGEKLKANFQGWSGDRKHFYVATNERDPQAFDLYRYAADGYARELLFQNDAKWTLGSVSKDGRWLSLTKIRNNADSDVHLADLADAKAEPRHVTPHQGDIEHGAMGFTADSAKLLYSTNGEGEFDQIWAYDIASGKQELHTKADWDVVYAAYSETGKYKITSTNADARTVLSVVDAATGNPVPLPELDLGDILSVGISRSESKLLLYAAKDTSSADLHLVDLGSGAYTRLTDTMNPAIDPSFLVQGEVVRYKSFDGTDVPAILYKPRDASATNKVPATLWVHGGPGGQSRLGYSPIIQYIVNQGYAVLAVNNRGSSGYGKTFFHMDDRNHGDGDLKDCVEGRKYLQTLDWIDGERVAISGGSYGGFMVLAALAFQPDAFDAGVDIFGVSNWWRTLTSIPPWWGAQRDSLYAEIGDPTKEEERLKAISPLFHADKIKKPLLVIQGANDPRVLKAESDEIVEAVKKNNVPVEYIVFEDEGHGFEKKTNQIASTESIVKFLNQHLATTPPVAAGKP
jgi:prolyl oligopeptidase